MVKWKKPTKGIDSQRLMLSGHEKGKKSAPPLNYKPIPIINQKLEKMRDRRYYRLLQLVSLLYELQPQARVRHEYKQQIESSLQSRTYIELVDLLIRQMTLLNRVNRMKEDGVYKSERSDLVMAVQLLNKELRSTSLANSVLSLCYVRIKNKLGYDRVFTRKDIEKLTGYGKSQSNELLRKLELNEKIERVGGNRKVGYYYQLKD